MTEEFDLTFKQFNFNILIDLSALRENTQGKHGKRSC